jgi:enediyne biosynthesis protein E4
VNGNREQFQSSDRAGHRRLIGKLFLRTFVVFGWTSCLALLETDPACAVSFSDVTSDAGIVYPLPETIPPLGDNSISQTGGAAAGDFDNDGWPDLFITRYWDSPFLYRNNHDGTFSDVTSTAFSAGLPGPNSGGASWADIDNDGDLDLHVSNVFNSTGNQLYINDGSGHFDDQINARGAQLGGLNVASTSASFGDYDNDGYLDMYVTEWRGLSGYTQNPPQARLLRNRGAAQPGHFDDVTAASGAAMGPLSGLQVYQSNSFTPRFVDFDRDGNQDIVITSDFGTSKLFWNDGDGTFTDGTSAIASHDGISDMGLAIGDYDGDGMLDWFTSDICHPSDCNTTSGNRLFRNSGNRVFLEASNFVGVRDAGWGWGTEMLDYDNDKDLDIVVTNGYYTGPTVPAGYEDDAVRLFRNNGQGPFTTTFTDVAASVGMTSTEQGRGLLKFDYDRDGDLDVFIVNNFQEPVLYRNDGGNQNDWLQIETIGTISNANGAGAFITVTPDLNFPNKKLVNEVTLSSSFLSQSEPIAHFGLGTNADLIDLVRIEWPASGIVQELYDVAPNQLLSISETAPGDFDLDGDVDGDDLGVWNSSYGINDGADADGDGDTDGRDFLVWQRNYGIGLPGELATATAVPEASSAILLILGVLAGQLRARIRRQA